MSNDAFDRRPPAGLDAEETPLNDKRRYMRLTNAIFSAFGWEAHPVGKDGYFKWSAPAYNGGVFNQIFADCAGEHAEYVCLQLPEDDADDHPLRAREWVMNDLALLCRLAEVRRTRGIGLFDVDALIKAMAGIMIQASDGDPEVPLEVAAALLYLGELLHDGGARMEVAWRAELAKA